MHDQLLRIEKAYFYEPSRMTEVHPYSGTVSPLLEKQRQSICLVSGNGNRPLAEAVALLLGVPTHNTSVTQYASGEVNVRINEPVLGADVYIVQSIVGNELIDINTALLELLILLRKMHLSNAKSVTVIAPFLGYTRQDKMTDLRVPIPASAVAQMIVRVGAARITTLDLHTSQIQGFFKNVPVDHMLMCPEFGGYIISQPWFRVDEVVIVAPDTGGVERAKKLADFLGVERIASIVKRCTDDGLYGKTQLMGEVAGLKCIVVDDIVDTGETLVQACELLHSLGALQITACVTHGIFSHPCTERVNRCEALTELVVSDSIPQEMHQRSIAKLRVLTIAPLIATVIDKYVHGQSVSSLFVGPSSKSM